MKRLTAGLVLLALWLVAPIAGAAPDAADIAAAKSLYAAASYDEALALLDSLEHAATDGDIEQIEQYRALCLLAIGKTTEAEQSLERIVKAHPLYQFEGGEVSPKLVELFDGVRKRVLPSAAKDLYGQAKASFEAKQYKAAADQFKVVMAVVDQAGDDMGTLTDLKELSDGFLRLAQSELAAQAAREAEAAKPVAAPAPPVARPPTIYTLSDTGVTPPVAIKATPPPWSPRNPVFAQRGFKGLLQIIIDEQGAVESVALEEPVSPDYDPDLLRAARDWTFEPAMKDGKPVKFMKRLEIVLQPNEE